MKSTIKYERFFAYSEENNKFFYTEFNKGINIIHGKNTSGKSTLIQAILYTFGINDEKNKLNELLKENVLFRLDMTMTYEQSEKISIIRDDEIIVIKRSDKLIKKFTGISGNKAAEHTELKEYLGHLFGFKLSLESAGEYKQASIESMFLPYYIAQDVGWVYRHKSFRGLDFIKNFKRDFFDYYLGIINDYDRDKKYKLENLKKEYDDEIKFLLNTERKKDELHLSILKDEKFIIKATEYIEMYKTNKSKLIELEKKYLIQSNKLAYLEQRKSMLARVKKALKKQIPFENDCPTCNQQLPTNIEAIYEFYQDYTDTEKQIIEINAIIKGLKDTKGSIHSLKSDIQKYKELVSKDYEILVEYNIDNLTFNTWIDNKTNVKLSETITTKIGEMTIKLKETIKQLSYFKTAEEIMKERDNKDYQFKHYFEDSLSALGVKEFDNNRFLLLYKIPAFPKQGVELLKTLLAYSFSFNKIIEHTDYVHRFPFMLDAIFEGDLEDENRNIILEFIYKNQPKDTQIIMSIADSTKNKTTAQEYNTIHFENQANLICIGKNSEERAFLSEYKNEHSNYLEKTLAYLDSNI
ncbi:MAG: ATP-binding protein [Candidatus Muirbacterium halophilum]|nr:ATP-binding protein [Candidatus Muirbacterium halophilum]MCK9477767.1 ATP-binding protein [Candidatus Muirbacterium halophilum]